MKKFYISWVSELRIYVLNLTPILSYITTLQVPEYGSGSTTLVYTCAKFADSFLNI